MTDEIRRAPRSVAEQILADHRIPLHLTRIGAPVAWVGGYRGEGASVAVVDSGIDNRDGASRRHLNDYPSSEPLIVSERWDPDRDQYEGTRIEYGGVLTPRSAGMPEAVQQDYAFADEYGHGTKMAGIIAARPGFDGVMGVAPRARIYNYKVADADGIVTPGDLSLACRLIVEDQARTGVRVALFALDELVYGAQQDLAGVLWKMAEAGIVIVIAASDHPRTGKCLDDISKFPSNYGIDNLVVVAAHDGAGMGEEELTHQSNWGKASVHLAACGRAVPSVAPTAPVTVYGTSAAAALVAGAAALVAGAHTELSAAGLRAEVLKLSRPVLALRDKTITGGVLDLSRLPPHPPAKTATE